jgi:hypothetical protein
MKRDMDLIRLLLMRSADYDVSAEVERYSVEQRAFHIALLQDAGYVLAVISTDERGLPNKAATIRLTWQGYEFLQSMTDSKIWQRAKDTIIDAGVPWTASLLFEWLKLQARQHIPGLDTLLPPSSP